MIGIRLDRSKQSGRFVFKFALELVGIRLTADRTDRSVEDFIRESFGTLTKEMRHATNAIHLISGHRVLPKFRFL